MKMYYVYILTNSKNTVLYIGITNNLERRVWEHKHKVIEGFTNKYNVNKLVYFENYIDPISAIQREKQLKNWKRQWKIDLIHKVNPSMQDIGNVIFMVRDPESSSG